MSERSERIISASERSERIISASERSERIISAGIHRRLAAGLVLSLVAAGCVGSPQKYAPLADPSPSKGATSTSTTVPFDLGAVNLPVVAGTTTTVAAIGPGPVTIVGRIDGPDGPVGGAIVHLDRMTGNRAASLEVPTAPDGSWNAANVLGGQYRIRAWLAPSLGMAKAQLVFVESPTARPVVLRLERLDGTKVDDVVAPNPPPVGARANLKVRVQQRVVDARGFVQSTPKPGVRVTLSGTGSWSVTSPNPSTTDADGAVTFGVECLQAGDQPLSAVLDDGTTQPLGLPSCASPTTTTTTATTTTGATSTTFIRR